MQGSLGKRESDQSAWQTQGSEDKALWSRGNLKQRVK